MEDLDVAHRLERQILKEKHYLGCGCVLESKYGHPAQRRGWLLVDKYIETCEAHEKLHRSFDQERACGWNAGSFIPRWRDHHGLWVLRDEWVDTIYPHEVGMGEGVFEYKDKTLLLLAGYLGTPVTITADSRNPLGKAFNGKLHGRSICLDLDTGKTFPAPVPDEVLRHFGWTRTEG